jgi:putative ABC transport system permease protein
MRRYVNWLSQVAAVTKFGLLSIPQRGGSVGAAIFGIGGVVAVLVGVLSMGVGFRRTLDASGSPNAAIVLRSGADSEMFSGLTSESTRIIADAPGIARAEHGACASPELYVIIGLPKRATGTEANVPMRGVMGGALKVRDNLKLLQGRMFEWGKNEVVVGVGAVSQFAGLEVGGHLRVGRSLWPIVGIFSAGGGTADSEIWTDASVLQAAYHRGTTYQSVNVKLLSPDSFPDFKAWLNADPRLNIKALRQDDYYAQQSKAVNKVINTLGYLVAALMAVGAVFGALNTMYSSVSARTREIATLRALGFGGGAVVVSVMIEAMAVAVIGGALGAVLAYFVFNGLETSTMSWPSFNQVTFAYAVTPDLLVQGIVWAVLIGLIGGLFPAIRGARLPIAAALREL